MTNITNVNIDMINSSVSQLVFDPLETSHEGSITCQVVFEGSIYEESVNVSVNGEPYRIIVSFILSMYTLLPLISSSYPC